MISHYQADCSHGTAYSDAQRQLQELGKITAGTITSKETQSRLSKLTILSKKMNDNAAPKKPHHSGRSNQVHVGGDGGGGNLNIRISGANNNVTVADSKRISVETPAPSALGMEQEVRRLATFQTWPHSAPVSANALARAGFYFMGTHDQVQCFACLGIIKDWEYGDTAMGEHKKHFPRCPFVRDTNYKNVPLDASRVKSRPTGGPSVETRAQEKASGLFKASPHENKKPQGGKKAPGRQIKMTCEGNPTRQPALDSAENETRLTFRSEYKRLLSFQSWPRTNPIEPRDLAKAGFYSLEKDDIVQCFACFGKIKDWEPQDVPAQEHARHFPSCPFVLGLDVKNEPITALQAANAVSINYREPTGFATTLHHFSRQMEAALPQTAKVTSRWEQAPSPSHILDKPKYPDFTGENARFATFAVGWPGVLGITPQQLARAGFFFTGEGDSTKCFYCGGGLKHWESTDEPWTEHAKWFSVCEWLVQQRGQTFVSYVVRNFPVDTLQLQRAHGVPGQNDNSARTRTTASSPAVAQAVSSPPAAPASQELPEEEAGIIFKKRPAVKETALDEAMKSRLTNRVLEMGYDPDLVKKVVQRRLQTVGKEYEMTNDLLEAVWQAEERRTSESWEDEEVEEVEEQAGGAKGTVEKFTEEMPEKQGKDVGRVDEEISVLSRQLKGIRVQDPAVMVGRAGEGLRDWERPQSPEEIEREIERLRDEKLCKVCMDNDANTVLMPCTHLVVCDMCASSLSACPICRKTIMDVVKVFKS